MEQEEVTFKFVMEYKDALIEVVVPEAGIPDEFSRKEWLQNTVVDMYARLRHMVAELEARNAGQ